MKLDRIDAIIINTLTNDARSSFKEVGEACGLSRAAVHQRVQRLNEKGFLSGSGFRFKPSTVGYKTAAYVGLKLEKVSFFNNAVAELEKIPEVVECSYTTGPYSVLLKVYARDNEHLLQLLSGKIQQINGVVSTETLMILENNFTRPLKLPLDRQLL